MIHYPRLPISKLHLENFPDSMEFHSWKVNFKTKVNFTMQWINEVEMTKSNDDLMTSQSITGRRYYPDNEMLHAMMASACSKIRPILAWETNCLHDLTTAYEAVQGSQNDNFQDFDVRWDQALLSASEMPSGVILAGLYTITGLCSTMDSQINYD